MTLHEALVARTIDAAPELVEQLDKGRLRCYACGNQCPIPEGAAGVCKVRFNDQGRLRVPFGYVGGVQCDPIEKKPFFHAYPGALAFSLGMLGCDLHCSYCQNWVTSQALRDPVAGAPPRDVDPITLADDAVSLGAQVMVYDPYVLGEIHGLRVNSLDQLLTRSRVITLHARLTA